MASNVIKWHQIALVQHAFPRVSCRKPEQIQLNADKGCGMAIPRQWKVQVLR